MEYKETYDYFYNKAYLLTEQNLRKKLIQSRLESKVFYIVRNEIDLTRNKIISKKSNIKLYSELNELNTLFCNSIHNYNQNNIELALRNEVHPMYLKLNDSEKPSCYTFKKFVSDLAMFQGHCDVIAEFRNQVGFYQEKYDQNDLEDLRIKKQEYLPTNDVKIELKDSSILNEDTKKSSESVKELETLKFNLEKFTDNDKAFIYHLCLNEKYKIPMTEKVKLLLIAGEVHEINIYQFSKNFDTFYSKVNKGIDYSSSVNKTLSFFEQFIEKLSFFNLKDTNEILKSKRYNFILENKNKLKQNKNQNH